MRVYLLALPIFSVLSACASIPDVTYQYYPAKWSSSLTVTQTVACTPDKKQVIVLSTPTVATQYAGDASRPPLQLRIKDLQRWSADAEVSVTFTDDGRLKSINQSNTGQGEAVVKSAVTLLTALGQAGVFFTSPDKGVPAAALPQCALIESWGGNKPITLTYRAAIGPAQLGAEIVVPPSPDSQALYDQLQGVLPGYRVKVSAVSLAADRGSYTQESGDVVVEVQKTGIVLLDIFEQGSAEALATAQVIVPAPETYKLPIPKAALFGKQSFVLSLAESGAVTTLTYGKTVGAPAALNALYSAAATETPASEVANLKAEAELIIQQQRLVTCRARPVDCK